MKKILSLIVVLALLIGSSAPFFTGISPAIAQGGEFESFSPELAEQLTEIYQQKQSLTPVQRKIDSSIIEMVRGVEERISAARPGETPKLQDLSTPLLKIDDAGNIEVKLTVTSLSGVQVEQLEALGINIRLTLPKYGVVEGSLPYDQVEAVAGLDFVVSVGTPGYAMHNTGEVTSAGDTVLKAAEARAAFGVDGSGTKVGVISDGVTHLSNSVATGDLPSTPAVDVLQAGDGDEGTAMLEIIHDLAPGAPLAFYAPNTSSDMVAGIAALEAAGCKVIVDDLTWSDEPKFEDGAIAQEARNFFSDGGVYVTSAGNSAQRHYMGTYVRTGGPGDGYDYAHDYGGGDVGNTFTVPNGGSIVLLLQWNNQWGQSGDDFALVLHRSSDQAILVGSDNYQTGNGNPWEGLSWTNDTGSAVTVFIAIWEWSLVSVPSSLILDYHVWYGSGLQYVTPENSVIGHSAVEEVLSTAAADAATPDTIEDFSSRGPGTVYFPSQEDRQVPNITGVDGVHTKTGQLGHFSDPFYGTSASAPHVAAIAALVWEADTTLTSSEVFNAITSTAVDLGSAGYDYTWGLGRVDAYEAVANVAGEPDITVSPTSFDVTLAPDTTQDYTLTIGNSGGDTLTYSMTDIETTGGSAFEERTYELTTVEADPSSGAKPSGKSTVTVTYTGLIEGLDILALGTSGSPLADAEVARLNALGADAVLVEDSAIASLTLPDLEAYDVVYLPILWGESSSHIESIGASIQTYVNNGGGLVVGQCSGFAAPYTPGFLPYSLTYTDTLYPECGVTILDPTHYITTGLTGDDMPDVYDRIPTATLDADYDLLAISSLEDVLSLAVADYGSGRIAVHTSLWSGGGTYCVDDTDIIIERIFYWVSLGVLPDCLWLDETPKSGSVAPGDSDIVTVSIDTTGLVEGSYSAEIVITSNDTDEASTTVPVTLQVSAPGQPDITVSPTSFDVTLAPDTTQDYTLTIGNSGGDTLTYSITDQETSIPSGYTAEDRPVFGSGSGIADTGSAASISKDDNNKEGAAPTVPEIPLSDILAQSGTTQVLAWVLYSDYDEEYPNTLNAISQYYTDYAVTESTTTDPGVLASELAGKDVFLVPEPEMTDSATLAAMGSAFSTVLGDFVNGGGTVIVCCEWDWSQGFLLNAGLMSATFANPYWGGETFTVVDPTHPITAGLGATVASANAGASYSIADADIQNLIEDSGGYPVVAVRDIGSGHVVINGYDYYAYNDDAARIIANAVEWAAAVGDCSWLDETPKSGSVAPGDSDPITVSIDTTGLAEGSYSAEIVIASNDPDEASTTVPVTLQVSAAEPPTAASVSPNSGEQGETLEVTIGGTNFTGATAVSFGDGITVNSFTVFSATQITANISISLTATAGPRDVSVTTPDGTGALAGGFNVVATGEVIVSVDAPDEAAPDSDFTANVNITEVVDFDACNYDVSFDASVLRLDDVTSGLIGSTTIPVDMYNEISSGTYRIIQNIPGLSGVSGSGYLAVLHFHVIGSAGDSSTISLSNGMLANNLAEEIPATWVGDSVNVTSVLPGDANGDGNVNALDIVKVERMIAGLDTETPGADANQDGNINALDIVTIERIIAGLG